MAIKRGSKVETSFGSASMTDLMFLLLVFLMVATTLINSNALQIQLPKSSNTISDKPTTTVTITHDFRYFLDKVEIPFSQLENQLRARFEGVEKPLIMLNVDKRVTVEEYVRVLDIAKNNNYPVFLVTEP